MHHDNIEAARRETQRLITYTSQTLADLLDAEDLVRDTDPDQKRQLDRDRAKAWRRALENEMQKVTDLEAVIAVVGAAKAGKSTLINAIVGSEILPNRAKPMTTFPTLVRHTPGRIEPVLRFPLAAEFNQLAAAIKARIAELVSEKPLEQWFTDAVEREIAQRVFGGAFDSVPDTYLGNESILEFLAGINDLCRLAGVKPIGIELPDPQGRDGVRLPVIEVQFHHIGAQSSSTGRLTILDSPGPNEYGQSDRLENIVREQLGQASAVMLVCDCTQDKTEATAELQLLVREFLSELVNRLFLFANKIDQLMAKDDDVDQLRDNYSRGILEGALPPDRVFPVAARDAFLANWALRQLDLNGGLPDPGVDGTTADFGKGALGKLWRGKITNLEEVQLSAEALWQESLFDEPLQHVIRSAADNAALISLKGASAKVLRFNTAMDNFLKLRESAATQDVRAIQEQIEGLQADIDEVHATHGAVNEEMKLLVAGFNDYMRELCTAVTQDVQAIIQHYFEQGRIAEAEALRREQERRRRTLTADLRSALEGLGDRLNNLMVTIGVGSDTEQAEPYGGPLTGIRTFRQESEARTFVDRINRQIRIIFERAQKATTENVNDATTALAESVRREIDQRMSVILTKAQERLAHAFDVQMEPPGVTFQHTVQDPSTFRAQAISKGTETYTSYEQRAGRVARVQRWFGDLFDTMWGYDEIVREREIATVNLSTLRDLGLMQVGRFESEISNQAKTFVDQVLRPSVTKYFDDLADYLGEFRGDLLDALEDTALDEKRLRELEGTIKVLRIAVEDLLTDSRSLADALEAA